MMLQIMAYTVAIAAALSVVGYCIERVAGLHRLPRRAAWIAAMLLSVLVPVAMMLGYRTEATPVHAAGVPGQIGPNVEPDSADRASPIVERGDAWKPQLPSDRQLIAIWVAASSSFALYLLGAGFMLQRRASRWQRATVLGQAVLISEVTGPALLGVRPPRIVVPRWLQLQPVATQALILEHERQHMKARDPLLMVAGLFVIAAVPWNLPLWWQWRRLRQAVEMDCDARVLRSGADASAYAKVLLEVTRRATSMPAGALAMSEPVAALERRIEFLVPDVVRHANLQTLAVLGLAAVVAGTALTLRVPALPYRFTASPVVQLRDEGASRRPVSAPVEPSHVVTTPATTPTPAGADAALTVQPRLEPVMVESSPLPIPASDSPLAAVVAEARVRMPSDVLKSKADRILVINDLNNDGIITRAEATEANQALFFMWDQYDKDRDGQVSSAEVTAYTNAVELGTVVEKLGGDAHEVGLARKPRPELVISISDMNRDGIVTRDEAAQAGSALNRMWHLYDLNKDDRVDAAEVAMASGY